MNNTKHIMIVGLNNPDPLYKNTRHNIGYEFILAIHKNLSIQKYGFIVTDWAPSINARFSVIRDDNIINYFVQPTTGMNSSGGAIPLIMQTYNIPIENIFVFHDDIDLEIGRIKVKTGGSSGGHNGLKSIDECIGQDYNRIRIGVGKPKDNTKILDYVLGDFSISDKEWIIDKKLKVITNLQLLMDKKFDQFMKKCN